LLPAAYEKNECKKKIEFFHDVLTLVGVR
jgi:hypothetical protein